MTTGDVYDSICAMLKVPGSQRLRRVVELLLNEAEAKLVAALPGTIAEVAGKTGVDEGEVRKTLDALYHRGVLVPMDSVTRRNAYRLFAHAGGLRDFTVGRTGIDLEKDKPLLDAWYSFFVEEARQPTRDRMAASGKSWSRLVPAYAAVKDLPDLQPWEDYHEILKTQKTIAAAPCACRYSYFGGDCSHTPETKEHHCLRFDQIAEFSVDSGNGVPYTLEQAIAIADKAERDGLMHNVPNHRGMVGILSSCNCCSHCGFHVSLSTGGLPLTLAWQKTRFAAYQADPDKCSGCQTCVERCYFDAVEMVKVPGSKKLKAAIDGERCFGCGLCVVGCPEEVLKMKTVRPVEWVPEAPEKPEIPEEFAFEP